MGMLNSDIEGSVLLATHEVVQKEREEKLAENVKNRLNIYVQGNKKDFLFAGEIKRNLSSCVNFLMQEYSTLPPILSNDGQVHEKQCPRNCSTLFHSSGVFCLSWTPHTW